MADRDTIKATIKSLCAAVGISEDAGDPQVAERLKSCEEATASWEDAGAKLPAVEPVLQAANALLDALHETNPEGLPFAYRDWATETLTLLDEAEAEGFEVTAPSGPKP